MYASRLICLVFASILFGLEATPVAAYKVPDSGQTQCYDTITNAIIACPAPGSASAQDGSYLLNPVSFTNISDEVVTDANTGLMWQRHDSGANQYTWDQAVAACNSASTGGLSGWRLPSKQELLSIVDYSYPPAGTAGVSTNPAYFPDTQRDWYWTSTQLANSPSYAWYIDFDGGKTGSRPKTDVNPIRCVLGTPLGGPSLISRNDGTATDARTGLMWMTGEAAASNWAGALSYCEGSSLAGHTDWRLPEVKELDSIADSSLVFTMSKAVFPAAHDFYYWASTTNSRTPANAWSISASNGYVNNNTPKSNTGLYTRCVRNGCEAALAPDLSVHIPFLTAGGYALWADLVYLNGLDFSVLRAGFLSDTSSYNGCTPTRLTAELLLRIPAVVLFTGDSYWADFIYAHDTVFTLTGAGQGSPPQ